MLDMTAMELDGGLIGDGVRGRVSSSGGGADGHVWKPEREHKAFERCGPVGDPRLNCGNNLRVRVQ